MQLLAVNFHYFRENKTGRGIFPLTLKEFENQIERISKFYDFVSENDIIENLKNGKKISKNSCLLTFDDGLKEQMSVANLLLKKGIPGMFYVSSEPIKNNTVLDVHKLHFIRSILSEKELYNILCKEHELDTYSFNQTLLKNQYRYDNDLGRKIKYFMNFVLSDKDRKQTINFLFKELVSSEEEFAKDLYMSFSDLKKLSKNSMLGTHAKNHIPLGSLSEQEIEHEIKDSISDLNAIIGENKIRSISYPYGGITAVTDKVANIAEKSGLDFGLTMWRGINDLNDLDNKFLLKRIDTNDAPGGKLNSSEYILKEIIN
jgi:peptidoglycan/xylan/chitin deacetylase (PgdA/CDA1 family)